jgi:hypothetical protein
MKLSLRSQAVAATLLFPTVAFALNTPGRAEFTGAVQRVAEHGTQADTGKTGVGSPGGKAGPSTGATPPATEAGSQAAAGPRGSKAGASDNPAEPVNPGHPPTNNTSSGR